MSLNQWFEEGIFTFLIHFNTVGDREERGRCWLSTQDDLKTLARARWNNGHTMGRFVIFFILADQLSPLFFT